MTLDDWIELAIKLDDALYEGKRSQEKEKDRKPFAGKAGTTDKPKRWGTKEWVSEEEVTRRRKAGCCPKCGSNKHDFPNCPEKSFTNKYTPKNTAGKQGTIKEVEEHESSESEKE